RQTVFWGECLKIQKRQLTRNELVALNFIILGISLISIGGILTLRLVVSAILEQMPFIRN
ncbi:hypothetical protein ABJB58_21840, partial [Bacteroides ovatus]|uniref:hypothetical protein n=1 Tax=Bacteroides ovatus TaxID=28116 RepID=UPI001E627DEF